ncbi:prolyl oligopeptidase family serine peptidase [Novosphingobium cyanobacteriorum]|uniref:prolyl oligopeptidase n=1 Tax=Novosphingobium cyanobacteriorum TaxID=3024215 RepID=A0ABT6CQ58_9SPHN|nr:prolyl oligopeptidase family serine peptidase [Novosphingobium cyanobacteriorum]MDF8335250.1 prolyl oligopeptidase family serine peptidase [Novosphingobium cyanobacteriorum]
MGKAAPGAAAKLVLPSVSIQGYPATRREGLVERLFGQDVADPYRWLEGDVRKSPEVAQWVAGQNAVTRSYLAQLPGRDALASRIRSLFDYERFSLPRKAGKSYFYLHNTGLQNQSTLMVRDGLKGEGRVLLDPNAWQQDGKLALDAWTPSRGGRWLAYTVQQGGSDWRTIRVVDVKTGRVLDDTLRWANDTLIGWVGDEGFLYSRYPAPKAGEEYLAPAFGKAVWYHRLGTPQDADRLVYATPDRPELGHKAMVTSDGRWAVITSEDSTLPRRAVHLVDLAMAEKTGDWQVRPLVPDIRYDWKLVDGLGDRLWFITNDGAPNYRLVRLDLGPDPRVQVVIPEGVNSLEGGRMVGDRLVLSYIQNGQAVAVVTDMKGKPATAITINGIGSASGFGGRAGDPETFYQFSSFNQPPTVFRMDMRTGQVSTFAQPKLGFDPADYEVEQRTYPSKDGTQVPLYIVRKRSLAQAGKAAPTLLYGYGGFDIAMTPSFSPVRMAWLEAGGVFALAQIRGGGEFGRAWYDAGRLEKKQNSFDDFIAAGEFLIKEGITPKGGLAVQGGSNGGMMVGAVVNQRPDLFAAANPDVGVMDMLRFDRFTQGRFWTQDYGSPAKEADWKVLRAYSPYHNIAKAQYPAILVTTADTDDRVVPAHSFKYVAALQAGETGDRPHLLRVESDAGHGSGKPVDKTIAGGADVLSFLAYWTGLKLP